MFVTVEVMKILKLTLILDHNLAIFEEALINVLIYF